MPRPCAPSRTLSPFPPRSSATRCPRRDPARPRGRPHARLLGSSAPPVPYPCLDLHVHSRMMDSPAEQSRGATSNYPTAWSRATALPDRRQTWSHRLASFRPAHAPKTTGQCSPPLHSDLHPPPMSRPNTPTPLAVHPAALNLVASLARLQYSSQHPKAPSMHHLLVEKNM